MTTLRASIDCCQFVEDSNLASIEVASFAEQALLPVVLRTSIDGQACPSDKLSLGNAKAQLQYSRVEVVFSCISRFLTRSGDGRLAESASSGTLDKRCKTVKIVVTRKQFNPKTSDS